MNMIYLFINYMKKYLKIQLLIISQLKKCCLLLKQMCVQLCKISITASARAIARSNKFGRTHQQFEDLYLMNDKNKK